MLKQHDVDLEKVVSHELSSIPPALFNNDGSMRKTTKSDLAIKIEATYDEVHDLPHADIYDTAYIVDGMALLQSVNDNQFTTFNDLGSHILHRIQTWMNGNMAVSSVTIVFDRYDNQNSIKALERERCMAESTTVNKDTYIYIHKVPCYVIQGGQNVPNYRKFLQNASNKSALAEFISRYIVVNGPDILHADQSITLAGGFKDG